MSRIRSAVSLVFGAWRVRPMGRRLLWLLTAGLFLGGLGLLLYPFITDLISDRAQSRLAAEFRSPEFQERPGSENVPPGGVVMRIVIPKIGVDALVVEGTDPRDLRAGAGHYSSTADPCERGNVGIAGHRNVYGKPFLRLDELEVGDQVTLVTPSKSCTYQVVDGEGSRRPRRSSAGWITEPNDGGVLAPLPGKALTLTTCNPKNSARDRLIVRAKLVA